MASQNATRELKNKGAQLWKELKQLHLEVVEKRNPTATDEENPEQSIDDAKEKKLQAEIAVLEKEETSEAVPMGVPTTNPEVLYEMLTEDLSSSVHQLELTDIFINSEIQQTTDAISNEEQYLRRHQLIRDALDKKLRDLDSAELESHDSVLKQYGDRREKLSVDLRQMMKKMASFVNEHYPVPDEATTIKSRQRHSSGPSARNVSRTEPYKPMLKLLEMLLNQCIDSPFDPYVDITEDFWPPHIELLLRYQLVTHHPEIDSKIKLTPFHL